MTSQPDYEFIVHQIITMSGDTPATENAVQTASAEETGSPKTPQEQLEVEDPEFSEEHINYPTGPKLWLTTSALTIALFLTGLVRFPGD